MRSLLGGLAMAAVLLPVGAFAQQNRRLEVTVPIEVQFDGIYDSADRDAELADTSTKIEPAATFHLGRGFSIESGLTYEPINDPANDRFFSNQGLYVKELYLRYAQGPITLYGGKISPPFGVAWDLAPGIYGPDFGEDYELTERIGFGGSFDFAGPAGTQHTFSANTFYQDHSGLSRSWFHRRAQTRESGGGASNTGDFSSFSAVLAGETPSPIAGLNYQVSFDHLAAGQGNTKDENAVAIALFGEAELAQGWSLEHMAEIAFFQNAKVADEDRSYATVGLTLRHGAWDYNAVYSVRSINPDAAGLAITNDELFQFGLGREIYKGVALNAAYRYTEQSNVDSHTVGLQLTYEFGFGAF
jgi:hypothetical protein